MKCRDFGYVHRKDVGSILATAAVELNYLRHHGGNVAEPTRDITLGLIDESNTLRCLYRRRRRVRHVCKHDACLCVCIIPGVERELP